MSCSVKGRFAPTPSGRMHVGNVFTCLIAYIAAKQQGGEVVLRIDDLDPARSKSVYTLQLLKDLEWFGFEWVGDILYQSKRYPIYSEALSQLMKNNQVYPCFCTRAELSHTKPFSSTKEAIYQRTCAHLSLSEQRSKMKTNPFSLRISVPSDLISFQDMFQGYYHQQLSKNCGDFIVRRKDGVAAYQLATVVDDAYQGVTQVIRGIDLLTSTPRQIFLQEQLSLQPVSQYGHVPLLVDNNGIKLSKRNNDASLEFLITKGLSAQDILGWIAYVTGIIPERVSCTLEELVRHAYLPALQGIQTIVWKSPL